MSLSEDTIVNFATLTNLLDFEPFAILVSDIPGSARDRL
jgi:hypothetical protein